MGRGRRLLLCGAPGVGKGTYAHKLSEWLKLPHLSTGAMARAAVAARSPDGLRFRPFLQDGNLLPAALVTPLLKRLLKGNEDGFLLDGYPRVIEQVAQLDSLVPIDGVVHFTLREDILIRKITARRVCADCSRGYNLAHVEEPNVFMPAIAPKQDGVCDACNGALVQREDDTIETVRKRLAQHKRLSQPVLDAYAKRNLLHEFEIKSGISDTWPIMQHFLRERDLAPQ